MTVNSIINFKKGMRVSFFGTEGIVCEINYSTRYIFIFTDPKMMKVRPEWLEILDPVKMKWGGWSKKESDFLRSNLHMTNTELQFHLKKSYGQISQFKYKNGLVKTKRAA